MPSFPVTWTTLPSLSNVWRQLPLTGLFPWFSLLPSSSSLLFLSAGPCYSQSCCCLCCSGSIQHPSLEHTGRRRKKNLSLVCTLCLLYLYCIHYGLRKARFSLHWPNLSLARVKGIWYTDFISGFILLFLLLFLLLFSFYSNFLT